MAMYPSETEAPSDRPSLDDLKRQTNQMQSEYLMTCDELRGLERDLHKTLARDTERVRQRINELRVWQETRPQPAEIVDAPLAMPSYR